MATAGPARVPREGTIRCRFTNTTATPASTVRSDSEVLRRADRRCPSADGAGREAAVVAGHPVQGHRLVHHRLRAQGTSGAPASSGTDSTKSEGGTATRHARSRQSDTERRQRRRPTASRRIRPKKDRRRPAAARARPSCLDDLLNADRPLRYSAKRPRQVRPPQREVDHRLQEPELVAGVVPHALDFAGVDRARSSAGAEARWSAGSRRSGRFPVSRSAAKMSGVRM